MNNIVKFPTNEVREWSTIEKIMCNILDEAGASSNFKDVLVGRMKLAYRELYFSYDLSLDVCETDRERVIDSLTHFRDAFQKYASDLLLSRLMIEIELAKAQGIT